MSHSVALTGLELPGRDPPASVSRVLVLNSTVPSRPQTYEPLAQPPECWDYKQAPPLSANFPPLQ